MIIDKSAYKWASIAIIFAVSVAACDKPGSAERLGEKIDESAERTGEKIDAMASKADDKSAQIGEALGDAAITTKVKSAILAEPGLKVLQINVDTKDGIVTLSGAVDNDEHREKAQTIAQAVEGVVRVENNLVSKSASAG